MSFAFGRERRLPNIPIDINANDAVAGDEGLRSVPSSKITTFANTNKALPSINVEKTLSEEEMSQLHELWNGAGLSARAHRKRRPGQKPAPRRIPAPISIPAPGATFSSADLSTASTTSSVTGIRKRLGFLSASTFSERRGGEKKAPNALEMLRGMAQDRLKRKLRCAKSAPNLGDREASSRRGATFQLALRPPVEAVPEDTGGKSPCSLTSPSGLATPKAILQPDNTVQNAIYFTVDPSWRASQDSVQFQFITPIPDSPTSVGRPDSPLLHRHHSLDQLSFAAVQATKVSTAMEFPEYPGDEVLHPIDELHAYLEL